MIQPEQPERVSGRRRLKRVSSKNKFSRKRQRVSTLSRSIRRHIRTADGIRQRHGVDSHGRLTLLPRGKGLGTGQKRRERFLCAGVLAQPWVHPPSLL